MGLFYNLQGLILTFSNAKFNWNDKRTTKVYKSFGVRIILNGWRPGYDEKWKKNLDK